MPNYVFSDSWIEKYGISGQTRGVPEQVHVFAEGDRHRDECVRSIVPKSAAPHTTVHDRTAQDTAICCAIQQGLRQIRVENEEK